MLRSILMIFIIEVALINGIVTYVSELSQNLVSMNEKFWAVCYSINSLILGHPKHIRIFSELFYLKTKLRLASSIQIWNGPKLEMWKCILIRRFFLSILCFRMWPDSTINVGVIWSRKTKKKPIYDHDVKEIFGVAISVEKFFAWSKKLFFSWKSKHSSWYFAKLINKIKKFIH